MLYVLFKVFVCWSYRNRKSFVLMGSNTSAFLHTSLHQKPIATYRTRKPVCFASASGRTRSVYCLQHRRLLHLCCLSVWSHWTWCAWRSCRARWTLSPSSPRPTPSPRPSSSSSRCVWFHVMSRTREGLCWTGEGGGSLFCYFRVYCTPHSSSL